MTCIINSDISYLVDLMSNPSTVENHPVIGIHRPHRLPNQLGIQVEHHHHGREGRSEMHISCRQGSNIGIHDFTFLCHLSGIIQSHFPLHFPRVSNMGGTIRCLPCQFVHSMSAVKLSRESHPVCLKGVASRGAEK